MTWLDVERRLRERTNGFVKFPDFITAISCYSDGAEITLRSDEDKIELREWLDKSFGKSLDEEENILTFGIENITYPIDVIIQSEANSKPAVRYPLWRDLAYFPKQDESLKSNISPEQYNFIKPEDFPEGLRISAFHSFKGGVGRTTALMTHLGAYITQQRKTKVLLIDADLEAPGITYWLDSLPSISFIRFLEAVHYPPSSVSASVQYCAAELRKSSILLDGHEIFVLPACTDSKQPIELLDTPVLPEHLARNPKKPWYVGDVVQQLATELEVELVLIDLRAGLSELASPLLFDPRIEHFIVSTIAPQSVNGAALILERMSLLRSLVTEINTPAAVPTVILSLLTPALRESRDYDFAIQRFSEAFPNLDEEAVSPGLEFIDAFFDANLMCIRDFKQAIELGKNSPLSNEIKGWITTFSQPSQHIEKNSKRQEQASSLEKICGKYIYAENGESENLLLTEPLRNLAKYYENTIPVTVSIGAKGSGKTFNFLQLCREKRWEDFLKKLKINAASGKETLIFPLLSSHNLKLPAKTIVDGCRKNCFRQLGLTHEFSEIDFRDRIKTAITRTDTDWDIFWTRELLEIFGVQGSHLRDLNQFLLSKKTPVIILIDGLEDQFSRPEDAEQKKALVSLLRFPDRIEELRDGHLGIIEFVRSDYVRSVIQQNLGQFEDRYKNFTLEWTAGSFLRLAYWICVQTELPWAKSDFETLSDSDLLIELYQLWGQKLGYITSKEAPTARWVFGALCDLNARLQARDLVRFLFYAAKESQSTRNASWEDRVLLPEAMRAAVRTCSKEKVEEAISEIAILRQWNEVLKTKATDEKIVPFNAQNMGLTPELSKSLQDLGVIIEDKDKSTGQTRFYLPEIYRSGLEFSSVKGGRPRILALMRNSVKWPF